MSTGESPEVERLYRLEGKGVEKNVGEGSLGLSLGLEFDTTVGEFN
jgi:hypothetical protein